MLAASTAESHENHHTEIHATNQTSSHDAKLPNSALCAA
jgi:hypothetical protein